MRSLSDFIEKHILDLLKDAQNDYIELQRSKLAEIFRCVPSQINYVLQTRFTPEKGYIIESRRGEGGYIRIVRLSVNPDWQIVKAKLNSAVSAEELPEILDVLVTENALIPEEARLIELIIKKEERNLNNSLRAMLLRSLIILVENARRLG